MEQIECLWARVGGSVGLMGTRQQSCAFLKMREISRLSELLLAYQGLFCSVEKMVR
jgi:hypothetical protein